MKAWDLISAAFPGDDEVVRSVRVALLRVLNAGTVAESELAFVASWLDMVVSDPPYSIWYQSDRPGDLARALHVLASELERAGAAMTAAQPHWREIGGASEQE